MSGDEWFEIIDDTGAVVGRAPRSACHGDPRLMHQVVHVLVTDSAGRLFLQKRSPCKDIQPGKWDTSVGGHVMPGEPLEAAAARELREELGVANATLAFLYYYIMRSPMETERVATYETRCDGPFCLEPGEIETGRFWELPEIEASLGQGIFTPNFEEEYQRWQQSLAARRGAKP